MSRVVTTQDLDLREGPPPPPDHVPRGTVLWPYSTGDVRKDCTAWLEWRHVVLKAGTWLPLRHLDTKSFKEEPDAEFGRGAFGQVVCVSHPSAPGIYLAKKLVEAAEINLDSLLNENRAMESLFQTQHTVEYVAPFPEGD